MALKISSKLIEMWKYKVKVEFYCTFLHILTSSQAESNLCSILSPAY